MKNNIAAIRKSKNISQKNLAKMVGISNNWMNHVESGKRRPSTELLERIADKVGVSSKDIF